MLLWLHTGRLGVNLQCRHIVSEKENKLQAISDQDEKVDNLSLQNIFYKVGESIETFFFFLNLESCLNKLVHILDDL